MLNPGWGKTIKKYRSEKNITLDELSKMTGIPKSTLSYWEAEKSSPAAKSIFKVAEALQISILDLANYGKEESNIITTQKVRIPILGKIACGQPILAEESLELYLPGFDNIKADYALWAQGDSMIDARINDGDLVFIKQQATVENGEIAAVLIDNEATLKRVYYDEKKAVLTLVPANIKYQPFIYQGEELNNVKILGKAIAFQSLIK